MQIEKRRLDSLYPAVYNPRKDLRPGDPEYEKIKRSIQEFDCVDPLIINADGTIIGGHQRWKVLRDLGYTEVECSIVSLDKTREKALNVALNKVGGEWDDDKLAELLKDIEKDIDATITGFDMEEIRELIVSLEEPAEIREDDFDVDAALAEPHISMPGDLWQLGKHRLICGDSTDQATIERLVGDCKPALIVTDPPYNVNYEGKTADRLTITNDNLPEDEFERFLLSAFTCMFQVADDGAAIYVFHADSEGLAFRSAFNQSGFKLAQCCVWVKQSLVMGRQDYQWQHEPILYGWKPTAAHRWHSDRKQTTVWNFDKPVRNNLHPTMKPISLMAYPIENSSKVGETILDPFGGSGSTLIACEQLSRNCLMAECDPKYVDVIIRRFIEFSGVVDVSLVRNGERINGADLIK